MRFLHRLRQAVADRCLRSRLRREKAKIEVLLTAEDIDEDVRRAAVEQVKRKQERVLEEYVEHS